MAGCAHPLVGIGWQGDAQPFPNAPGAAAAEDGAGQRRAPVLLQPGKRVLCRGGRADTQGSVSGSCSVFNQQQCHKEIDQQHMQQAAFDSSRTQEGTHPGWGRPLGSAPPCRCRRREQGSLSPCLACCPAQARGCMRGRRAGQAGMQIGEDECQGRLAGNMQQAEAHTRTSIRQQYRHLQHCRGAPHQGPLPGACSSAAARSAPASSPAASRTSRGVSRRPPPSAPNTASSSACRSRKV